MRTADGQWLATLPATDRSGFYEARLTNKSTGKTESRRYAVNVDAAEGDLRALFGPELAARLQPEVKYQFDQAETFELTLGQQAGYNLGEALLYLLVAVLIGEQLLAWSASYHPPGAVRETAVARELATPRRRAHDLRLLAARWPKATLAQQVRVWPHPDQRRLDPAHRRAAW